MLVGSKGMHLIVEDVVLIFFNLDVIDDVYDYE